MAHYDCWMLRCSIIPLSRLQGCLMLNDELLCASNNAKNAGIEALGLRRIERC